MPNTTPKPKRSRGRPTVRVMPEQIPDTPENVVRALCQRPPKRDWKFMQPDGAGYAPVGAISTDQEEILK